MAQTGAIRRLKKEYANLHKDPPPGANVQPLETNFLHAHFILHGEVFHDTPFEGGVFHGVLKFPSNYPLKPPTVIMRTPSGRFQPDKKICFSMSDFHPELWNPMWSIRSIITGLVSFMNSEEITTGGVKANTAHRIQMAKESLKQCMEYDPLASGLFSDELATILKEREASGSQDLWPPKRQVAVERVIPKVDESSMSSTRRRRIRNTTRLGSMRTKDPGRADKDNDDKDASVSEPPLTSEANASEIESTKNSANTVGGKNAARNKKKREREKRKKIVKKFTADLKKQTPNFIKAIEKKLLEMGIDVTEFHADHICWRTETVEEYTELTSALQLSDDYILLIESEVGNRSIATFRMKNKISFDSSSICVVEIPAPKEKSPYKRGLEHIEYIIGGDNKTLTPRNDSVHQEALNELMARFTGIQWITKAQHKEINPDVSTKVEVSDCGTYSVKFHLTSLAEVISYEKSL